MRRLEEAALGLAFRLAQLAGFWSGTVYLRGRLGEPCVLCLPGKLCQLGAVNMVSAGHLFGLRVPNLNKLPALHEAQRELTPWFSFNPLKFWVFLLAGQQLEPIR